MVNPYKYIRLSNGKNTVEHRVIMSKILGRELLTEEIVHHINGNPKDNREENLELTNLQSHGKHHARPKVMVTMNCSYCKKFINLRKSYVDYKRKNGQREFFCNKICSGKTRSPPNNNNTYDVGDSVINIIINEISNGLNGCQIAKKYNISKSTIYFLMRKNNIERSTQKSEIYKNLDNIIKLEIMNDLNGCQISKKYNISKSVIYRHINALK